MPIWTAYNGESIHENKIVNEGVSFRLVTTTTTTMCCYDMAQVMTDATDI